MKRKVLALAITLLAGLAATVTLQAGGKSDKDKLQGSWDIAKVSFNDKEFPTGKKSSLVITGSKAVTRQEGMPDEETTFTLDETKKPRTITFAKTAKEEEVRAIYKLEGDTLTVAMTKPGSPAPATFETKDVLVITLKKAKK